MEGILNRINDLTEIMCCLNRHEINERKCHFNDDYHELSNYYSYFNSQLKTINNSIERSSITNNENEEYVELLRSNKLFGSPVSLKNFVQDKNEKITHKIFERLELNQKKVPINEKCLTYNHCRNGIITPKSEILIEDPVKASNKTPSKELEGNMAFNKTIKVESKSRYKISIKKVTPKDVLIKSNPLIIYKEANCNLEKTPSLPSITDYKDPIRFMGDQRVPKNNHKNNIVLTSYGTYLLGL